MAPDPDPGDDLERGRAPGANEVARSGSVSQCTTVVALEEASPPDGAHPTDAAEAPDEKDEQTKPPDDRVQLQDQSNLLPRRQLITVFLCLSAGIFLSVLDQSVVATALPSITQDFNAGSTSTWVATAYLLTGCAVQPLYGRFSDIFGRKVMMLVALGIFVVFSLACALAQSITQLIVFRAFAGAGGGAIMSLSMIIISDVVSLKQRGKYQGIVGAVIAVGNGIGPLIGSVFSQHATWRWCFWINLPVAVTAMVICAIVLPLKRVRGDFWSKLRKVDFLGSLLVLVAVILVLLALNWGGQTFPWTAPAVLVTMIVGVAVFTGFIVWEGLGAALPTIPLRLFRNRTIVGIYITTVALGVCFFIPLFYIPQFFQVVRGYSAIDAGLMLIPLLVVQVCVSFLSGLTVSKTGHYRPPIILGYTIWAVGNGLISTFDESTSVARSVGYLILQGAGAGMTFQTSLVGAQAAASKSDMAVTTSTRNFIRMLSGTLGVAISSSVINNSLNKAVLAQGLPADVATQILADPTLISSSRLSVTPAQLAAISSGYVSGFRVSFYIASGFCVAAWISAVFIVQHHDLTRQGEAEAKAEGKKWVQQRKEKRKAKGGTLGGGHAKADRGDTQ